MSRFTLAACLLFAAALTAAGAVVQGHFANRWGLPDSLPQAARRLAAVPDNCGSWRLVERMAFDKRTADVLHAAGYLQRKYEHQETGQRVTVAVIVGPPGPTSVHIPEICYSSAAYDVQGQRAHFTVGPNGGTQDEFWGVTFRSLDPAVGLLRVAYAWNAGQRWVAPESPRFSLSNNQALYKIQLAAPLPLGSDPRDHDPCIAFLKDFLPILNERLGTRD